MERRLLFRVAALDRFEEGLASRSPLGPNALSSLKIVATLGMLATLALGSGPVVTPLAVVLFVIFGLLDYLDGVVARGTDRATGFGRVWDRATDLPMLLTLGAFSLDLIPVWILLAKLAVDVLLIVLYAWGLGSTENRVRTPMSYAVLLGLLLVTRGTPYVTPDLVTAILAINITFSTVVALYNLRVLSKKRIADALSMANLACGVGAMIFATRGELPWAMLCLAGSALFDGLDGAAARRWGGSRFGVLMDDLADGLSYGVAPGYALAVTLPGVAGTIVGVAYALFVVARLVFFTLNKDNDDPRFFRGAPSTLGAIVTLASLHLFQGEPLLVGAMVGAAIVLMVSFDVRYKHLGRAFRTKVLRLVPGLVGLGAVSWLFLGVDGPIALVLLLALGYGLRPSLSRFRKALKPDHACPQLSVGSCGVPIQSRPVSKRRAPSTASRDPSGVRSTRT